MDTMTINVRPEELNSKTASGFLNTQTLRMI